MRHLARAPHAGSHGRFAAFGALAHDGRRPFRTHGQSGSPTFVRCPRELHRKFGRIAVVDQASQHRAAVTGDCRGSCGGEVPLYELPVGSPFMNASEEVWRRTKHVIRDPGCHRSVGDMRAAVGECPKVTRRHPGIFAYLRRKAVECSVPVA